MVDIKYKMNWVPQAKELRDRLTAKENVGIASKIDEDTDDDFYQNMYEALSKYFSSDEDADKVLIPEETDRDAISTEVIKSYDDIVRYYGKTGMLSREAVDVELDKVLGDPRMLEIPTKTFDDTEEVLSVEEVSDIASDAINSTSDADEVQPTDIPEGGLGSPEVIVTSIKMNENVLEKEFVTEYLASHEGTEDHKHDEAGSGDYGDITKAYGIKNNLGLNRDNYSSDKSFAAAVAMKHYVMAEKKYNKNPKGATWSDLGKYGRYAVLDLQFNAGTIGETADFDNPERQLKNTLEFVIMKPKKSDVKVSLMSLAERRAKNWNKAADDLGLNKITKIQQLPNKIDGSTGTTFNFLDKDGNEIYSFENSSPSIDKLLKGGGSTPLTKIKEVSL